MRGRSVRRGKEASVARPVLAFAASGLAVLLLVGVLGVLALRRVGTAEGIRQAEDITSVAGRGVVEPRLRDGILTGDAESLTSLDALITQSVLREPIVRVKIWDRTGRIVYSDAPELIGATFELGPDELEALRTDTVASDLSDLSEPENRFERSYGELLEVYLPVSTPDGHELLFETYLRFDSVAASGRTLWQAFLPALAVALVALAVLQIPLAWWLARRVRRSQRDRERLLQRAVDSSDMERRRIATDLHDGPVQQLAGLSMSLAATADRFDGNDPAAADALHGAADRTRQSMRALRSALVGIYLPTLRRAGLPSALSDLVATLDQEGIHAELHVPPDLELPSGVEALLYRASQEAIRNVVAHARATNVKVTMTEQAPRVVLEIEDDGRGFSPEQERAARADDHVGLDLLSELVRDAGGTLLVDSAPGRGTRVRLEVPIP